MVNTLLLRMLELAPTRHGDVKMKQIMFLFLPVSLGGSGDPSPVTAYKSVYEMKAAAKEMFY